MNFAQSRVVTHGRNAGQPRPITDIVLDGVTAAKEIAVKLKRQGATVIGIDVGSSLPSVQIMAGHITAELERNNLGLIWKTTTVSGLPERHGQAKVQTDEGREVLIVWVERERH